MQFREVAWSQQLYYQRLLHGPGAEATERSLPSYPAPALREIIRQSEHPHNVEPLLLTLRRPANTGTRKRFGEVAGELVLIEKVTNAKPVATDFKVAMHGQIQEAADGILYPTKDTTTQYEIWLRVEMLDVLRLMIEENLVRSLVPEMQFKLVEDMLQLVLDDSQHELVRLYSFCVAYAALKKFHAARAAAVKAGFLSKTAAYLAHVLDEQNRPENSPFIDPFEHLKALTTCIEALYFHSLTSQQGEYTLAAAGAGKPAAAAVQPHASLADLQRQQNLQPLLQRDDVAPLLVKAVEKCWQLLQDRDNFTYTPPASSAANGSSGDAAAAAEDEETEEQKQLRKAAEEAIAAANVTFDENWQTFLKAVYDTELVPSYAFSAVQLGCGLLQLLAHEGVKEQLSPEVLQQMASYSKEPLIATTGSILAAAAAPAAAAADVDGSTAIVALPQHQDLELGAFAKLCWACNKAESREVKLLRCSQCGVVFYCSGGCQKADWKVGHKMVCKQLAESRTKLAA